MCQGDLVENDESATDEGKGKLWIAQATPERRTFPPFVLFDVKMIKTWCWHAHLLGNREGGVGTPGLAEPSG